MNVRLSVCVCVHSIKITNENHDRARTKITTAEKKINKTISCKGISNGAKGLTQITERKREKNRRQENKARA